MKWQAMVYASKESPRTSDHCTPNQFSHEAISGPFSTNAACGNILLISQFISVMEPKQNRHRNTRVDPYWLIERYASVVAQLHDGRGNREVLLGERNQLIEQGRRIGLIQLLCVDEGPEGV